MNDLLEIWTNLPIGEGPKQLSCFLYEAWTQTSWQKHIMHLAQEM